MESKVATRPYKAGLQPWLPKYQCDGFTHVQDGLCIAPPPFRCDQLFVGVSIPSLYFAPLKPVQLMLLVIPFSSETTKYYT